MPASTRQRTVRQPARSSIAKACRQATNGMRPLTDEEDIGGPISTAAENPGTCVSTATAHKRDATRGRPVHKAGHRGPHGSSSRHRGVTQHKRTKKWEAHLWDDRRQVYPGGFDCEEDAARAHDVMAMKCRGVKSTTNYDHKDYEHLLLRLEKVSKDDVRQLLMRKASTFARGSSKYRGVTKHKSGKWEARLGQTRGRKHSYIGLFDSEVEAARAYDMATVTKSGLDANTNFSITDYAAESQSGLDGFGASGHLDTEGDPAGGLADIDRGSVSGCLASPNPYSAGVLDLLFTPPYPKQTLNSFPSPPHDSFSSSFSVGSLDLPTTHMGASSPPLTTHMGSPHLHQTPHAAGYSSANAPIVDHNPLARGPVVHKYGFDIPLSRPDRAFQWRQVDPSPSDSIDQPFFPLERTQAFGSAQATSASKWPNADGTFWSAEATAGDRHSTQLMAGDRHATQTQTQTQIQTQTQTQTQAQNRIYIDEMMSALSSRAHPAKLAADMQQVLHNSKPVRSPDELQQRLESTGSPIPKYTDWYRPQELQNQLESSRSPVLKYTNWYRHGTSPAATTAAPAEEGHSMDSLGAKLTSNGFGGYGSAWTGAQGPLAAGRAVEDLSGVSWAEQPSAGPTYQSVWADCHRARDEGTSMRGPDKSTFRSQVGCQAHSHTHSQVDSRLTSPVSHLSSRRQPLFMADFDTSETDYFVTWARNAVHSTHSSYGRMYNGGSA